MYTCRISMYGGSAFDCREYSTNSTSAIECAVIWGTGAEGERVQIIDSHEVAISSVCCSGGVYQQQK
jgi:hypothetical protein